MNDKNLSLVALDDIEAPLIPLAIGFLIGFVYGYYSH